MTKKDFELIARVISDWREQMGSPTDLVNHFASELAEENPRFDKAKFVKACGVEVENAESGSAV